MQFAVPQFTDVEDKLIGPLTLKQFLVLLATGGLVMFFYSILKLSFFFFIFALPVGLVGVVLAFAKFNGRPLFAFSGAILSYFSRPQVRVFKREEPEVSMTFKAAKLSAPVALNKIGSEDESRLKKLAYLLDQKTQEEKALMSQRKDV